LQIPCSETRTPNVPHLLFLTASGRKDFYAYALFLKQVYWWTKLSMADPPFDDY